MYPWFTALKGLDVERMLYLYDAGRYGKPVRCWRLYSPCLRWVVIPVRLLARKACRRGTVDKAVEIRAIIKELAGG